MNFFGAFALYMLVLLVLLFMIIWNKNKNKNVLKPNLNTTFRLWNWIILLKIIFS